MEGQTDSPTSSFFDQQDEEDDDYINSPFPVWLEGDSLAPPLQSGVDVCEEILDLAAVTDEDVVCDLGCGDGRMCFKAVERGAKGVGVELEADLVGKFRAMVQGKRLDNKIKVVEGDMMEYLSGSKRISPWVTPTVGNASPRLLDDVTVVVMYLLPEAIEKVKPFLVQWLAEHSSGVSDRKNECNGYDEEIFDGEKERRRIVCNTWGFGGVQAKREVVCGPHNNIHLRLYDGTCFRN